VPAWLSILSGKRSRQSSRAVYGRRMQAWIRVILLGAAMPVPQSE
jgi:hypothetical protein